MKANQLVISNNIFTYDIRENDVYTIWCLFDLLIPTYIRLICYNIIIYEMLSIIECTTNKH